MQILSTVKVREIHYNSQHRILLPSKQDRNGPTAREEYFFHKPGILNAF